MGPRVLVTVVVPLLPASVVDDGVNASVNASVCSRLPFSNPNRWLIPLPSSWPRSPSASPSALGGCGCTHGVDAAPLGSLLVLWVWVWVWVRRRRGAPRQPA